MAYRYFIGIDVSKATFDATLLDTKSMFDTPHRSFSNDVQGLDGLLLFMKETYRQHRRAACLFCMESTGIYALEILEYLAKKKARVWVENALQIKRSLGVQRGKTDKSDSLMIAKYAAKNSERVRLFKPPSKNIQELRYVSMLRHRLVECNKRLSTPLKSMDAESQRAYNRMVAARMASTMASIAGDIKGAEDQMHAIIKEDPVLARCYELVVSVPGIGFVIGVELLIITEGFTRLVDAKKLACYCGVAPFPFESGSSVQKGGRISKFGSRRMKTALTLSAWNAIRSDKVLREYYDRKVAEGKAKMSVTNAVRSKILARVVSVVVNDKKYVRIRPDKREKGKKDRPRPND